MEDKKVIAREYSSVTRSELIEGGYWKAVSSTTDKVLYEGEDAWIEETVDAMAIDLTPQKAIEVAMNSVLQYIVSNVYQNGFKSLVDFREYERNLEAKKAEEKSVVKAQGV